MANTPPVVLSNRFLRAVTAAAGSVAAAAEIMGVPESTFRRHVNAGATAFSPDNLARIQSYWDRLGLGAGQNALSFAQRNLMGIAGALAHPDELRERGKMQWGMANVGKLARRVQTALDAERQGLQDIEEYAQFGDSPP